MIPNVVKLALIGPPGSGKGSYGRLLAKSMKIPLITMSDVLKQRRQKQSMGDEGIDHCPKEKEKKKEREEAMASGKLVDDAIVSETLMQYLLKQQQEQQQPNMNGYILDGFPRTIQQVYLMEETWPLQLKIDVAVNLDVPIDVCETKLLGRRICTLCGHNYNVNGVQVRGFDLPPYLPRPGDCYVSSSASLSSTGSGDVSLPQHYTIKNRRCDPDIHWEQRKDDDKHVIRQRLELHVQHTTPILDYFDNKNALFQFTPYKGFDDIARFQSELEEWLIDNLT